MKQWLSEHILSSEDFIPGDDFPLSNQEFFISLSMVGIALVVFAIIVHLF